MRERRAGRDVGNPTILDLPGSGAPCNLQGGLRQVPETMEASFAQGSTVRVDREFAPQLDPPVLDPLEPFAFAAKA
jgi:hypothetical protein